MKKPTTRNLITGREQTASEVKTTNQGRTESSPKYLAKRIKLLGGLSGLQHAFIREKVFGLSDKDAAILAGYSLSVANNTKQKIWSKSGVREEYQRLRRKNCTCSLRPPDHSDCASKAIAS